jgi:sirohydrochlorin ferrochelatase
LCDCFGGSFLEAALYGSSAYFLVSHGSRDPRPQLAMDDLAQQVAQALASRTPGNTLQPLVQTGVLELGQPLHQQLQAFAEQALEVGYESITLLPMFLLPGVHVMDDIPTEVVQAESQIQIQICPYLGTAPDLWRLLDVDPVRPSGRVLISHGSRRPAGQQTVEAIAAKLGAIPAYWSIAPDLDTQVTILVRQGVQEIEVLPYFLFEGGTTDAIAQKVAQLQQQYPAAQIHLRQPIGATPQLVTLILELLAEPTISLR